jgi:hypothetical protein
VRRSNVLAAFFCLHFGFIALISWRDILWLVANHLTIASPFAAHAAGKAERVALAMLGQNFSHRNVVQRALDTYFSSSGIDRGYGYFAPNVPSSYKLVFELHYGEGRVEYERPGVNSSAAELRCATLLDEIGRTRSDAAREFFLRSMTRGIWHEHPDAQSIRAIVGVNRLPTISEFSRGQRPYYEFLYAYDFSRRQQASEAPDH